MRRTLIALVISALGLVGVLAANAATTKTVKFEVALKGTNEKPAAPASNKGKAELTLNTTTGRVCWEFKLAKIDGKPAQAHIHKGKAGRLREHRRPARRELQAPGLHLRGEVAGQVDRRTPGLVLRERAQREASAGRHARPALARRV